MTCMLKSLLCCALGIALACFGVVHSVSAYPGPEPFDRLAADLPQLRAVLSFALGVLAALAGLALLILSIRRLRTCRQNPPGMLLRPGQGGGPQHPGSAACQPGDAQGYAADESYSFEEPYVLEEAYEPVPRNYPGQPHGEGRVYFEGRPRPLRRVPIASHPR
jgi:hypothetical protein